MKILIVHRLIASFGGAHKYLVGLTQLLADMGWEIHLLINPNSAIDALVNSIAQQGANIHTIDFDNLDAEALGQAFDGVITRIQPDIIDFEAAAKSLRHMALSSVGFKKASAVKVFTMHLPIVTDQSSLHSWKRRVPFSHAWNSLQERKSFIRSFDKGLSVSHHHARSMVKLLGLNKQFFTIIPNGVDLDVFKPDDQNARSEDNKIRIVACGGLTRQKRFDLLIEAAHILKCNDHDFEVLIAGEGVERPALETALIRYNLQETVKLLGHVTDMPSFLRGGDIYVMCSDSEGLPYAAIESMATGLPMVVTNAGELPYMVKDSQEGFVVDCGDDSALATAVESLIVSSDLRRAMGKAARDKVKQQFNSRITWMKVGDFYNARKL